MSAVNGGNASGAKGSIPILLREWTAGLILIVFALYLVIMIANIGTQDSTWGRYLTILTALQAFAATAGGVLLGATIKTEQVKTAQADAKNARNNLSSVANAAQRSAAESRQSRSKWFTPTRAVRQLKEEAVEQYVVDESRAEPTHWVVSTEDTKEVDPRLDELAALAHDLSKV